MALNFNIMPKAMTQIFNSAKRAVTHEVATTSISNITGSEEITYADGASIDIIFFKREDEYRQDIEGMFQNADCLIFDKADNNNIARNDKITVDGNTYIIQSVLPWNSAGTDILEQIRGVLV